MKKLMYLALSFALVFSLAACGEEKPKEEAPAEETKTEAPAEDAEAPAEDAEAPAEDTEAPAEDAEAPAEDAEAPAEDAEAPAEDAAAPGEAGFEEIEIGATQVGIYNVAGVYFQPVDMYPPTLNPSKEESDMHIEADIHLTNEAAVLYGFGEDGVEDFWPPYLNVKYYVLAEDGTEVTSGAFMPMNASDGPHYGANIKKDVIPLGTYTIKFEIQPDENGYLLHTDSETGVNAQEAAKDYYKKEVVEFEWNYDGRQLQD